MGVNVLTDCAMHKAGSAPIICRACSVCIRYVYGAQWWKETRSFSATSGIAPRSIGTSMPSQTLLWDSSRLRLCLIEYCTVPQY